MDDRNEGIEEDAFSSITSRQWWIFFDLVEPRSSHELAERSGLSEQSVRAHLMTLAIKGLIVGTPPAGSYVQDVRLSAEKAQRAMEMVRRSHFKPAMESYETTHRAETNEASAAPPSATASAAGNRPRTSRHKRVAAASFFAVCLAVIASAYVLGTLDDAEIRTPSGSSISSSRSVTERSATTSRPASVRPSRQAKRATPSPEPTAEPSPTQPLMTDDEIADQAFLAQIQIGDYPFFREQEDAQLTNLGRAICGDLDDGFDPYALAFQISAQSEGADEVESAALVGAAMGAYCYQHKGLW